MNKNEDNMYRGVDITSIETVCQHFNKNSQSGYKWLWQFENRTIKDLVDYYYINLDEHRGYRRCKSIQQSIELANHLSDKYKIDKARTKVSIIEDWTKTIDFLLDDYGTIYRGIPLLLPRELNYYLGKYFQCSKACLWSSKEVIDRILDTEYRGIPLMLTTEGIKFVLNLKDEDLYEVNEKFNKRNKAMLQRKYIDKAFENNCKRRRSEERFLTEVYNRLDSIYSGTYSIKDFEILMNKDNL